MARSASQNTTAARRAADNELPAARRKGSRPISGPYALMACKDCGALGCLVPVTHGMAAQERLEPPAFGGIAGGEL